MGQWGYLESEHRAVVGSLGARIIRLSNYWDVGIRHFWIIEQFKYWAVESLGYGTGVKEKSVWTLVIRNNEISEQYNFLFVLIHKIDVCLLLLFNNVVWVCTLFCELKNRLLH